MPRNTKPMIERELEFRTTDTADDGLTLEGLAAVFDSPTEIRDYLGSYTERIAYGAFKKSLAERRPVMQFDHGRDSRTGSVPIGVFEELRETREGLYVRARLHDNDLVLPIRQAIASQAISGMSVKFRVIQEEWRDAKGNRVSPERISTLLDSGTQLSRTIKEIALAEAGPVVFPAYASTKVGVRSETQTMTLHLAEK
ncbi:HK97 family phage prohead protease [Rhodococcus sp. IEGM 1370]|uniref:HK97 family phage prohead protease n=1 Tax=Rhodococcus sp. IEGM 1370 TaxID=3082222 RepID=UPI0029541CFA|nr:HK97 family phage prohead protease [Rhodococcus sp. IEGM 1370]MDV8078828.1 HK97 family phage prohead protease [Rhodococcus sp. IEGM 1370]